MNLYKDQCYICLDEKTYFKKSKVCVNDGCWMFICKQCFGELTKSDIANCPICHEDLVKESYYLDYLSFMKKARETMIKIVLYVVFYSIGLSTVVVVLIGPNNTKTALFDRVKETNSSDWLISFFVFPIIGFVTWYCIVVLIFIVYNLIKKKDKSPEEELVAVDVEDPDSIEFLDDV